MNRDALFVVNRLREHGFETYLVGGCVRDLLMENKPKDYDVATSARPEQVMAVFPKTIPVGEKFGVVIVRRRKKNYEVATFREDRGYSDGRRPDQVRFGSARADANRRDFTINGLFYDPAREKVIDYVGGKKDLAKKIIRAIGDPEARFSEDKLRMLRAVRFAARLGFKIERATGEAVSRHAPEILEVSRERIREELIRILTGPDPAQGIRLMDEYGLLEAVLPEVAAMKGVEQPPKFHPEGDVFVHTLIMLDMMRKKQERLAELAMAVLLHDVGKPPTFKLAERIRFDRHAEVGAEMTEKIMRRLRFSRNSIETVAELVRDHLKFIEVARMRPATLKRFLRRPDFDLHLELHRLDCLASHRKLANYRLCKQKIKEMGKEREQLRPPRLVSGKDLISMGLEPGPLFATILAAVEDAQLEGTLTTRRKALAWVRKNLARFQP